MPVKGIDWTDRVAWEPHEKKKASQKGDQEAFNSEPLSSIQGLGLHRPEPLSDTDACDSFCTRHAKDKYAII